MENQFTSGFWSLSSSEKLFPQAITEVSEYDGGPLVNISCTQLVDADDRTKRRILREWIEAIPSLPVRLVSLNSHVPEQLLVAVCRNTSIKGLYIKWTKAKSIEAIRGLNLEQLYLGSAAGVKDATPIMSQADLRILTLQNLKRIRDYSFLQGLGQLEYLSIEGGMYSRPIIDNLDFISELTNLQSFSLIAMNCLRPSLEPFKRLKRLVKLFLCISFSDEEMKQLEAQLPNLRYGFEYYRKLQEKNLAKINEEFGRQMK